MEENKITRKIQVKFLLLYGTIVSLVNTLGYIVSVSGVMPVGSGKDYEWWNNYTAQNANFLMFLTILCFCVPIILAFVVAFAPSKSKEGRFVSLPFLYATVAISGWASSFVTHVILLTCLKIKYGLHFFEILTIVGLNIVQQCIFSFTFAFLIIDLIHRKIVLPRMFPTGHLSKYVFGKKPTIKFVVTNFYISVSLFPSFFLTFNLIEIARQGGTVVNRKLFIVLFLMFVMCLIISCIFCDYFNTPITELKKATQKVIDGDYEHRVDIVSNDALGDLVDTFNDMTNALAEKDDKIYTIQDSIFRGIAIMVESRDNSTGGHISRTSDCVRVFIHKLMKSDLYKDISPDFYKAVVKATPMHDLGKIAVDDAILRKPGRYEPDEYEIMKRHATEGAIIVKKVLAQVEDEDFKTIAVNIAHYHHEKWDGSGYPCHLSGENIPLEARIMALADVFDALVSQRCYKESYSYDRAFEIIEESLGSHFDPELGKIFIECREELENLYDSMM